MRLAILARVLVGPMRWRPVCPCAGAPSRGQCAHSLIYTAEVGGFLGDAVGDFSEGFGRAYAMETGMPVCWRTVARTVRATSAAADIPCRFIKASSML